MKPLAILKNACLVIVLIELIMILSQKWFIVDITDLKNSWHGDISELDRKTPVK